MYLYRDGKAVPPSQAAVVVTLDRLGALPRPSALPLRRITSRARRPSRNLTFAATVKAQAGGQTYEFKFEQVEARVQVSDEQLKRNGVEIGTAGPARIRSSLQLLGEVKLNQDRSVFVTPRLTGLVESVLANAGDRVRRGQVLCSHDQPGAGRPAQ